MTEKQSRYFLPENETPLGFSYPQSYLKFIDEMKSPNGAMLFMYPWVFVGNKVWAKNESLETFGTQLVPFAQAEMMDMMAYFEVSKLVEPRVWVCNPWEVMPEFRVYEKLKDFSDWLVYAQKISQEQLLLNPDLKAKEFWFPKP